MNRTNAAGSVGGLFVDYVAGIEAGTRIEAEDLNAHQEELYNAIVAAGLTPSAADLTQLAQAFAGKLDVSDQAADSSQLGGVNADYFVRGTTAQRSTSLSSVDLNDYTVSGFYYCTTCINRPTGANGYLTIVSIGSSTDYCTQTYVTLSGVTYQRQKTGGTWGLWLRIVTGATIDQRITTGGARTERVGALEAGETAIINWSLKNTTGGSVVITIKTDTTTGTYQVNLCLVENAGPIDSIYSSTPSAITSNGTIAQDAQINAFSTGAGSVKSVFGFVKRIS